LRECYAQGAARFGWAGRPLAPRLMRDENGLLVGWGLGTAVFPAIMFQGQARAVVRRDGTGLVELGAQDMGQGAWTALAQIAADSLGLELEQLEFRSGSSDLPDAGIAGGSYVDGPRLARAEQSSSNGSGRLRSYVRPLWCGRLTAGPDGLRGPGPEHRSDV
jgi:CO/xanthine dehydrogenase Mo-binding subunit